MSQVSSDAAAFGAIVSNYFDGKATPAQTGAALAALGKTIDTQVKTDAQQVASLLGPQATAQITTGLAAVQQAAGGALIVLDDDVTPYLASGAKAVEGAFDTVLNAAVPGSAILNPLVNGGIDAIAAGLKAAIDAQAAAWKAKLAANAA